MALQLGSLRDALLSAGADPAKAEKAAEEAAGLASAETRIALLTWMVGVNATLTMLLVGGAFALWARLGEVSGQLAHLARAVPS